MVTLLASSAVWRSGPRRRPPDHAAIAGLVGSSGLAALVRESPRSSWSSSCTATAVVLVTRLGLPLFVQNQKPMIWSPLGYELFIKRSSCPPASMDRGVPARPDHRDAVRPRHLERDG
jgi:hypothetical protein